MASIILLMPLTRWKMKYFKILSVNNKLLDVASELGFRNHQQRYSLLVLCQEGGAQYLQTEDEKLYHSSWMREISTNRFSYEEAKIEEISEEEYNSLYKLLNEGKEIFLPEEESETIVEIEDEVSLNDAKESKLYELSLFCKKNIQQGFDVILSDEKTYHFSLEIVDQLNIMTLYQRALIGDSFLPYHADGLLCENFSKQDVFAIYGKMEEIINYHTIYHNSLKNYVLSLESTEDIKKINYGMEIPIEYQSDVLKSLIGK